MVEGTKFILRLYQCAKKLDKKIPTIHLPYKRNKIRFEKFISKVITTHFSEKMS